MKKKEEEEEASRRIKQRTTSCTATEEHGKKFLHVYKYMFCLYSYGTCMNVKK